MLIFCSCIQLKTMEVIMRTFSDTNPFLSPFTFHMSREDKMKHVQAKLTKTIAQIVRWAIVGILSLIMALPAIISLTDSI